jgi:hypothetical protein
LRRALLLAAALLAAPAAAQAPAAHDATWGTHGMVIFGTRGEFASHLPTYASPHDWQILLRVSLSADSATSVVDPGATLAADRASTGEVLYTLEPEQFQHSALAAGQPASFRATLYRGHFERGGEAIALGVKVRVEQVLHRRKLRVDEADPVAGRFFLLSTGEETFLVHRIAGTPDFDQIMVVLTDNPAPVGITEVAAVGDRTTGVRPMDSLLTLVPRDRDGQFYAQVTGQVYLEYGDLGGMAP